MYLKLQYSLLLEEVEDAVVKSLTQSLEGSEFHDYSKVVLSSVLSIFRSGLTDEELERCALLGEVRTSFLCAVTWVRFFDLLGRVGDQDVAPSLASFIFAWQKDHAVLRLAPPDPATSQPRSIIIPVDIPSITVVHTADITLDDAGTADTDSILDPSSGVPAVCINQLLPATLHLKWTRIWDTGNPDAPPAVPPSSVPAVAGPSPAFTADLEYSYEVTAPSDTWLVGGRRKGHFVIPGASTDADTQTLASSPDTEADVALLLIPLREGWLPYPTVEITEVKSTGSMGPSFTGPAAAEPETPGTGHGHCETDYRNLGETVRVIADRAKVTLSLDASGPGGGPLVLESESLRLGGRIVA